MADLIDRKELRDALYEADAVTMQGVKIINQFPAVDAVEIVRCRDCVHDGLPTCFTCYIEQHELIFLNHDPEFFCGAGERKDGDGNG